MHINQNSTYLSFYIFLRFSFFFVFSILCLPAFSILLLSSTAINVLNCIELYVNFWIYLAKHVSIYHIFFVCRCAQIDNFSLILFYSFQRIICGIYFYYCLPVTGFLLLANTLTKKMNLSFQVFKIEFVFDSSYYLSFLHSSYPVCFVYGPFATQIVMCLCSLEPHYIYLFVQTGIKL